jgi:hypothetical protein
MVDKRSAEAENGSEAKRPRTDGQAALPNMDAIAKAKALLEKQKALQEKLKKLPQASTGPPCTSIPAVAAPWKWTQPERGTRCCVPLSHYQQRPYQPVQALCAPTGLLTARMFASCFAGGAQGSVSWQPRPGTPAQPSRFPPRRGPSSSSRRSSQGGRGSI